MLAPLHQKQVNHTLDLPPVLKHVIRVVLENALQERSEPFQGLLVAGMQTALHWHDELPS